MTRRISVIGVPSGAGACGVGQDLAPGALRDAGLVEKLTYAGFDVVDTGDSPQVPWRPDRTRPDAQNLAAVVQVVQETARRVADALSEPQRIALVLGGDCTVGIGAVAGIRQAIGRVGLVYFDLHSDLNVPSSATDGALDWMALAHMLAIEGTEPELAAAGGPIPLVDPDQVVLFGHNQRQSTRFERGEIERLSLARKSLEEVRADPEAAAREALQHVEQFDHYAIHLDVDVVDFTDAPLSEHPSRNAGLKLDEMLSALEVLSSGTGLVSITLAELNPHNAGADQGLLDRFTTAFAQALRR